MADDKTGRSTKPLLRALAGETLACPPWWLMRQAGSGPRLHATERHVRPSGSCRRAR
jgi:hypothetical protein